MDAADLRVFETVARLGGMNRAAAALNTVQSNVTARIRLLEDELGETLFHRHSRGVALTDAGQRLLPYAVQIQKALDDAKRAVQDDGTPKGPLTIGSLETTAALRLSPVLAIYAAAYPAVDLVLRTGTTEELVDGVIERNLEAAFVCGPVDHPELIHEVVFREDLAVLTAPSIESLDQVLQQSELKIVVLRSGCSYRQRLEDVLAKRGIVGLRRLEFGTLEAIIGCVSAGLGITLLPRSLVGQVWRDGTLAVHPLPAREARVETLFIQRKDATSSSALQAFLTCAQKAAARLDIAS